jgi:HK97 family phage major capsid protein
LAHPSVQTQTASGNLYSEITQDDINLLMGNVTDAYSGMGDLGFICSRAFYYQVLFRLAAEAGGNTIASISGDGPRLNFFGFPCFFTDKMPSTEGNSQKCLIFGNFREASLLGEREGLRLEASEHVFFDRDSVGLRGISAYDINVHEVNAYAVLVTASS